MKIVVFRHRIAAVLLGGVVAVAVSSCATVATPPQPTEAGSQQAPQVAAPSAPAVQQTEPEAVSVEVLPVSSVEAETTAPEPVDAAVVEEAVAAEAEVTPAAGPDSGKAMASAPETVGASQQVSQEIPPNTFLVTSGQKDPGHFFYGIGGDMGMAVNGVQGKELVVVRGQTYTFKVDTDIKHDFYLSKSPRGWGAGTLTDGVKGNYTYRGIVTFTPNENTPDVVYYQCRNHKNMGSKIHVVDKGKEGTVVFGVHDGDKPAARVDADQKSAFTSGNQARQKVMFAEMFITSSPATKRIDASEHAEARQLLSAARLKLEEAKTALAAGQDTRAIALVDEALRNMTASSRLVPSEKQLVELRIHFEELLKGAHTYEKSYRRNLKMMQEKGKKNLPDLDIDQISTMIADAQKLADNNQFDEANKQLSLVQRTITGALTQLLADETMDYTLTFDNPQEEYEYEVSRYKGYEELIPVAIEQKNPPKQTRALMEQFVEKARSIYVMAGPKAREGDYKTAIQMLQGATSHLQRALRIVGVR